MLPLSIKEPEKAKYSKQGVKVCPMDSWGFLRCLQGTIRSKSFHNNTKKLFAFSLCGVCIAYIKAKVHKTAAAPARTKSVVPNYTGSHGILPHQTVAEI